MHNFLILIILIFAPFEMHLKSKFNNNSLNVLRTFNTFSHARNVEEIFIQSIAAAAANGLLNSH
jgi:hypothetical protein